MSGYENVVGGKLKLKGKALDVAGGIKKKKKKRPKQIDEEVSLTKETDLSAGESTELVVSEANQEEVGDDGNRGMEGNGDVHLTPAERRYMEQRERIDLHKMAKTADKSHRDRIEDFNQYLANMSEHYDIPKVGPG